MTSMLPPSMLPPSKVAGLTGKAGSPGIEVDPKLKYSKHRSDVIDENEDGEYAAKLKSMVTNYKYENNRRYHAYQDGRYIYPNDEIENDRLDIVHKMTEVAMGGRLQLAPIGRNPERILDIGTGTGLWAIEMGDRYPKTEILGNDLSPIQPQWTPPNVHFEVDDVEAEWNYSQKFDFIFCRHMANAIKDWSKLARQCFEFTAPNGYTEFIDIDLIWRSPDNTIRYDGICMKMHAEFTQACRSAGLDPSPALKLEGYLQDAGFTDIQSERFHLPLGPWALDPQLKHVGNWNYLNMSQGMESFIYRIFTSKLGYSKTECDVVCAKVRHEMRDPNVHMYFDMYSVYGRKPAFTSRR